MNILDIINNPEAYPMPPLTQGCRLWEMMAAQTVLENKYREIETNNGLRHDQNIPVDLDDPHGQAQIKDHMFRLIAELVEASECLKNRPHKVTQMPTDKDHFLEELSDALHFMLSIFVLVGLTPHEIYGLYFAKHQVNLWRQETAY